MEEPRGTDPDWRYLVVGGYRNAPLVTVRGRAGGVARYTMEYDQASKVLRLTDRAGVVWILAAELDSEDRLALHGVIDGVQIDCRLRRIDTATFQLPSRGFRWINEAPYNR